MFWKDSFLDLGACSGVLGIVALYRFRIFPRLRAKRPLKRQAVLTQLPLVLVFPCLFSVLSALFHPSESPQWLRIALKYLAITLPFITLLALVSPLGYMAKHKFELRSSR
jgi:uncharacterized membrane protein HdeD (DUF308 family)